MKIIMIFDQIQAGLGSKDDAMVPLTGKKEPVGPAVMMEPFLKEVDGHVVACLCCGSGTYLADPGEVSRKLCAMVNKLNPDVVICGPAFNYADYAAMSARVACDVKGICRNVRGKYGHDPGVQGPGCHCQDAEKGRFRLKRRPAQHVQDGQGPGGRPGYGAAETGNLLLITGGV